MRASLVNCLEKAPVPDGVRQEADDVVEEGDGQDSQAGDRPNRRRCSNASGP